MPLRDQLLDPIPGDNPAGVELRYDPLYEKLKEARRADEDIPQGEWQTSLKTADWALVIKLATEALSKKTKDLQIAAWLTEAKLRREGFGGLREGLDLIDGMVERFWTQLYPEIEDGDTEMRAAPLEWLGSALDMAVRMVPIDRAGHDLLRYKESRTVPTEADAQADDDKAAARTEAVAAGKLTPEEFDRGFDGTPKAWYKSLASDLEGALSTLQQVDERAQSQFGSDAPSFGRLREALEEVQRIAAQLLKRKLETDPDPVEASDLATDGLTEAARTYAAGEPGAAARPAASLTAEPTSRDDAATRIVGAARYLRKIEPDNPASYLMLRGFRWGELRAGGGGGSIDPRLLGAPTTQVRTQLKGLLLDGRWAELLEASEEVMGTPQGRGWIDLQRYALTACDELGSDHQAVAEALRAALRGLLTDLPQLLDMTLMDDTPTANAETRAWLRKSVMPDARAASDIGSSDAHSNGAEIRAADDGRVEPRQRDIRALALAEVRAGRPDRAVAILTAEASREKSRRGRFLHQAQLASIMVEAGHEPVAMPILEELIADIEAHTLESWEAGEMVAQPMALLHRCLTKLEMEEGTRQALYLRICRLDPGLAMSFQTQSSG
jgi:type VI secretion system protein ImpA